MKRILLIILGAFLILASIGPYFSVKAEARQSKIDSIQKEIEKSKTELKKIEETKADVKSDLQAEAKKLEGYQKEIKKLEKEIEDLKRQQVQLEYDINILEKKIKEREEAIAEAEAQVKAYMVQAQSTLHVNSLFEFLMGSEDFATMILRFEGMSAIKRHNEEIIRKLAEEKAALERDKNTLEDKKIVLKASEEKLEVEVKKQKAYEEKVKRVMSALRDKQRKLEEEADSINHKNATQAKKIKEIEAKIKEEQKAKEREKGASQAGGPSSPGSNSGGSYTPSPGIGGFMKPLPGARNSNITATVWAYDDGYPHMGVDIGAPQGTPIYAVGPGMVVATHTGCPSPAGWNLSSSCGYGYGNFVSYLVHVNGHNYGILAAHMSSVAVHSGQIVSPGQVIGYVGNSGTSSGAHLHIETINMGGGGISDAYNRWNGSMNFGTGSASSGGRRCDLGYGVPCRMNPHHVLGI